MRIIKCTRLDIVLKRIPSVFILVFWTISRDILCHALLCNIELRRLDTEGILCQQTWFVTDTFVWRSKVNRNIWCLPAITGWNNHSLIYSGNDAAYYVALSIKRLAFNTLHSSVFILSAREVGRVETRKFFFIFFWNLSVWLKVRFRVSGAFTFSILIIIIFGKWPLVLVRPDRLAHPQFLRRFIRYRLFRRTIKLYCAKVSYIVVDEGFSKSGSLSAVTSFISAAVP